MTAPFPAYPLAANKSNNTPSFDDHPEHHDDIANGMNSLQEQIIHDLVHLTGDESIDGNKTFVQPVNFGGQRATNAATPTAGSDLATMSYVLSVASGTLNVRGNYDASSNLFPTTGGSGPAGAVKKGDFWICSVAGTLTTAQGAIATTPGDWIVALVDTPAQTAANWDVVGHEIGYTPANDTLVVHLAGTETVTGVKRFNTRPVTSDLAAFWSVPVDGITDASTALATVDSTTSDLNTLVIRSGETLYVNTNLTLTNIDLDIRRGGLVKVGTGKTFQAPLASSRLLTLLDVTGTPGVFVPTNQPLWHPIWWGPVLTSNDAPTWRRAFAAKAVLGNTGFFTSFNSGQKFMLPIGKSRYADLDVPTGCDVGGVFGGTLMGPAATASAYGMKFDNWSGIHDAYIDSRAVSGKIAVWLQGARCYAHTLYLDGSNLGAAGIGIKSGDATGSNGNKIWDIFALGDGTGTGLDVEGSDMQANNIWFGSFSNNVNTPYGAFMCNGLHTWGARLNGLIGGCDSSRFTNLYSETNGFSDGTFTGTPTGGWGADFTGADGIVVEAYYFWHNCNGAKFSRAGNRVITDGVISGGTTLTSSTGQAFFSAKDVNGPVSGTGIPGGTTITAYAQDGLSATLSATSTNGAIASVTIGSGSAISCTNNVLGAGVFNDNLDTALEVDSTTFYCTGATFMSDAVKGGGSPVSRRGIHCTAAATATIRAKGSNAFFTQKLLVNDAGAGLDIELGRKRCVMAADLTDQSGAYGVATSFPYGYNDEWDLEAFVSFNGTNACDATVRFQPTGTNSDGYYGVFGALAGGTTMTTSSASVNPLNTARMNSTNPSGIVAGTQSTTLNLMVLMKGKFKAGTGTGDGGAMNLSVRAQAAAVGGALRTITDGTISGGTTLTSPAQANFNTPNDLGRTLVGTGIPAGAYISAVTSTTVVTISVPSTNGAVGSIDIGPGQTTFLKDGTVMTAIRRA